MNNLIKARLAQAVRRERRLSMEGLGVIDNRRWNRRLVYRGEEFRESRARLRKRDNHRAFEHCIEWLELVRPTWEEDATQITSYTGKHQVEQWVQDRGGYCYIAPGIWLAAAIDLEFEIEPRDGFLAPMVRVHKRAMNRQDMQLLGGPLAA